MGNAVKKDGWLTSTVEILPFGGCITAPFHAVAGNEQEAVAAVVNGLTAGALLVSGVGAAASLGIVLASNGLAKIPFQETGFKNTSETQKANTGSRQSPSITRALSPDVQYITIKAIALVNNFGFALSVDDNGALSHHNRNTIKTEWEGWVIESILGRSVFLSRNKGNGKFVLAIDNQGNVLTTQNRVRGGWEGFELIHHLTPKQESVITLQRVAHPRFWLACSDTGRIQSTKGCNLNGWEAWKIK
jgi:hypothetical protein